MSRFALILPAAGRSSRFGAGREKKVFAELAGRAVWLRAVDPFLKRDDVAGVVLAIAAEDRELVEHRHGAHLAFFGIRLIEGGAERHDTVARALESLADCDADFVAIHDAARPCATPDLIDRVFRAAIEHGAALPGLPVTDTLKRADADGTIRETVSREGLRAVQTPQVFRRDWLEAAYAPRGTLDARITDDAQLVEAAGYPVRVVDGSPFNLKITTADDLKLASAILDVLPGPAADRPTHPFADDQAGW